MFHPKFSTISLQANNTNIKAAKIFIPANTKFAAFATMAFSSKPEAEPLKLLLVNHIKNFLSGNNAEALGKNIGNRKRYTKQSPSPQVERDGVRFFNTNLFNTSLFYRILRIALTGTKNQKNH